MEDLYDEGSEMEREDFELFEKLMDEEYSKMPASHFFWNKVKTRQIFKRVDWDEELKNLIRDA